MGSFENLSTVKFQVKMKPAAERIYQMVFPGCTIEDLRSGESGAHILDSSFGIDCLIHLPSNQWISVQEKYRKNESMRYLDFTQEYMNATGTIHESLGEWFKLTAQLYFYGWASADETSFEKWFLMDVVKYKILINTLGGLGSVGRLKTNSTHGRASFYAIPLNILRGCFIAKSLGIIEEDNK